MPSRSFMSYGERHLFMVSDVIGTQGVTSFTLFPPYAFSGVNIFVFYFRGGFEFRDADVCILGTFGFFGMEQR